MIVDDDELVLDSVADILRSHYTIETTTSPLSAIEHIKSHGTEILITDLQMGEMHGLELVRRARKIAPALVAIVITGYGSTESAIEALRSGAFDFVEKPIRPQLLRHAVARGAESLAQRIENSALSTELIATQRAKALAAESSLKELTDAHEELQRTHKRLIHVEKLASVGQLASGVAHEINNPAAFILANLASSRIQLERVTRWVSLARAKGVIEAE